MQYLTKKDIMLKRRNPESHKGENGRVLIIGGSEEYIGAPALAGLAALRAGCDWVTIAAPEKTAWAINSLSPDLVTEKLKGSGLNVTHYTQLIELAEKHTCVLVGNGAGASADTQKLMEKLARMLSDMRKPLVLDADALKMVHLKDKKKELLKSLNETVMTPHRAEFETLMDTKLPISFEDRPRVLTSILSAMGGDNVILLKGRRDIIAAKRKVLINQTGNEGMTVAGTGDVLAGITASFIAQGNEKFCAAAAAAYVNGAAGDISYKRMGIGFTASDIIYNIPHVTRTIRG